jgi:hypothetical protein
MNFVLDDFTYQLAGIRWAGIRRILRGGGNSRDYEQKDD